MLKEYAGLMPEALEAMTPKERQRVYRMLRLKVLVYRDLGRPVLPDSEGKLTLELEGGSRILGLPGSERTIRGFGGVSLLLLDEAARVDDELYYSVRPMLATSGGKLVLLSTLYGKRGVFYREWSAGEGWERYRITAEMCPRIGPEFLQAERKTLPKPIYQQEYFCEFIDLEWQMFPASVIDRATDPDLEPFLGDG